MDPDRDVHERRAATSQSLGTHRLPADGPVSDRRDGNGQCRKHERREPLNSCGRRHHTANGYSARSERVHNDEPLSTFAAHADRPPRSSLRATSTANEKVRFVGRSHRQSSRPRHLRASLSQEWTGRDDSGRVAFPSTYRPAPSKSRVTSWRHIMQMGSVGNSLHGFAQCSSAGGHFDGGFGAHAFVAERDSHLWHGELGGDPRRDVFNIGDPARRRWRWIGGRRFGG